MVYGDGDQVHHAELSWPPGGGIMLGSARDSDTDDIWSVTPGEFGAYVVTDEPDTLFARATAAGAEILTGPARHRLRIARLRGPRPRGQPLVVRHLPRRPKVVAITRTVTAARAPGGTAARVAQLPDHTKRSDSNAARPALAADDGDHEPAIRVIAIP